MHRKNPRFSLQTIITAFACGIVALSLLVADVLISTKVAENTQGGLASKAMETARIVASTPLIVDALSGRHNEADIQPYVETIRNIANVRFITVIGMDRMRRSHPTVSKIGEYYAEHDADAAFLGKEITSIETGSFGRSLRAFAPVTDSLGRQVGVVMVGIMLDSIAQAVDESRRNLYLGICAGLAVGIIGSFLLARYIKKIMFGMEPFAIAKVFVERNAMLNSVREGILAVDQHSKITVANQEALRILQQAGICSNPVGCQADDYIPNTRLRDVLQTGKPELDQEQDINGVTIWTNRVPVTVDGQVVGAIATFRDKTEMRQLAEQLTGVRTYADALRAQTHEFMNKLHVIVGMVRMGCYEELIAYVSQTAQHYQSEVGFIVRKVKDPVLAGFLLGKLSKAREAGVEFLIGDHCYLPEAAHPHIVHELITIIGNLIDNALEAVRHCDRKVVAIDGQYDEQQQKLSMVIYDCGSGMDGKVRQHIFEKGYSTKGPDRGYGLYLVKHSIDRLDGEITINSAPDDGTEFHILIPYQRREVMYD